jgi:hypothetical protein
MSFGLMRLMHLIITNYYLCDIKSLDNSMSPLVGHFAQICVLALVWLLAVLWYFPQFWLFALPTAVGLLLRLGSISLND